MITYPTEPRRIGAGVEGISFNRCQPLFSDLIVAPGLYNWKPIDDALKGNLPIVLGIMANNPNASRTVYGQRVPILGLPAFMAHLARPYEHENRGTCLEYDYNDPLFCLVIEPFVKALGDRYDGHKNLLAVEIRTLGHWGEWTTYQKGKSLLFNKTVQRRIVGAYCNAFKTTPVLGRILTQCGDDKSSASVGQEFAKLPKPMGVHVDNFMHPNDAEVWADIVSLNLENLWRKTLIGAEIYPPLWKACLNELFEQCLKAIIINHISYIHFGYSPANEREWEKLRTLDDVCKNLTGYKSEMAR